MKGSSTFFFFFWSRLSDVGTVSLGSRLARKSGTAVGMSANGRAGDFEFVDEAFFSSHTLEQFFIRICSLYIKL